MDDSYRMIPEDYGSFSKLNEGGNIEIPEYIENPKRPGPGGHIGRFCLKLLFFMTNGFFY